MKVKVKLENIIDGMESQSDETSVYLNKNTGEVITFFEEELRAAEEGEPIGDFPDWQQEQIKIAEDVLYIGDYIVLPDRFDIHEWDIMKKFCLSIAEDNIRSDMLNSIHGSGAYRYFKDNLIRHDLSDAWYKFRYDVLKEIAVQWCQDNNSESE